MNTHLFYSPERSSSLGRTSRHLLRFFAWVVVLWPALLRGQATPKLIWLQNMNFGNVNAVTGGGTVVMSTGGALTPTGVTLAGGTVTNMQVKFNGANPDPYIWNNVPASAPLGGGITVDTWTSTPAGFSTGGILPTAPITMLIGATLHIPAAATGGTYTATFFNVTIRDTFTGNTSTPPITLTVTVTIINPMTLTVLQNLNFGTVAVQGAAGNCIVSPTSVRTATGGVKLVGAAPVAVSAQVRANGPAGSIFALTFTPGTMTGPGTAITVDTFTHNSTLLLNVTGQNTFNVGATAHLNFPQTAGTYTGTFTITATIP